MNRDRLEQLFCIILCILTALAVGISYGDSSSNHATYLPPGIQWADPSFLTHDWWLTNAPHYHWAFFFLVAVLTKIEFLPWGLATLNVVVIAGSLFFCFLIFRNWLYRDSLLAFIILTTLFLLSKTFYSVASTYLFTPSLQASSIATFATISAIYFFFNRRYAWAGIFLAFGGLFHTNYLLVNFTVFGLAYLIGCLQDWSQRKQLWETWIKDIAFLLGLSALIAASTLPLILDITDSNLSKEVVETARFAFFEFAVPFHYLPKSFLIEFFMLLGWQLLGIVWTNKAVDNIQHRRQVWALQVSMFIILWGATSLTTFTFIEPISRLFFWRIAPFSIMISAILLIAGTIKSFNGDIPTSLIQRIGYFVLSGLGVLMIARYFQYKVGITDPKAALQLLIIITLITFIGNSWLLPAVSGLLKKSKFILNAAFIIMFSLWVSSVALIVNPYRHSLIIKLDDAKYKEELFEYVKDNTPKYAQFLIPPDLDTFRLFGERAIVVDFKALPFDKNSLSDWYHRLELISGVNHPQNYSSVIAGYHQMNSIRLEAIRKAYAVSHVVLLNNKAMNIESDNWIEVFRNNTYRVLEYKPHDIATTTEVVIKKS